MERNKWETAIRCLEVALHPNTIDEEVLAGVNGFRRTADGTPLSDVCLAFAANDDDDGRGRNADVAKWRAKIDRINRDNLELRLKLEAEAHGWRDTARRLQEAEQRIGHLLNELQAARRQASDVELELGDFRAAYRDVRNSTSRPAVEPARHAPEARAPRAVPPFQEFLAAARQRAGDAEPIISSPEIAGSFSRAPWTA